MEERVATIATTIAVMAMTSLVFRRKAGMNHFSSPGFLKPWVSGPLGFCTLGSSQYSAIPTAKSKDVFQFAASVASEAALPYSFNLLCNVFRLMPRISAARVLLLLLAAR